MKKNYIAPQTEAIELLGENVIMAVSPGGGGYKDPNMPWGGSDYTGGGN